jgi:hypothetical protein
LQVTTASFTSDSNLGRSMSQQLLTLDSKPGILDSNICRRIHTVNRSYIHDSRLRNQGCYLNGIFNLGYSLKSKGDSLYVQETAVAIFQRYCDRSESLRLQLKRLLGAAHQSKIRSIQNRMGLCLLKME